VVVCRQGLKKKAGNLLLSLLLRVFFSSSSFAERWVLEVVIFVSLRCWKL
jgi:hypothetical protein